MAVVDHRGDKENVPPQSAAAAAARLHGAVAVKKLKLKRLGKERRRVPLRDITNLFLAATAAADSAEAPPRWQPLEGSSERPEAEFPPPPAPAPATATATATATAQSWLAGGVVLKPGRCSLRKEFR
uniref:Uncharacterized protein n=1 Tax=Oryza glumipatula TaxID=40148 RepID=A0A0E0AAH5_9ORYZ